MFYYPLLALAGYLLGTVPFAYLCARISIGKDLRRLGTGAGTVTACFRHAGRLPGAIALLGEGVKAPICIYLANAWVGNDWAVLMALTAAILGICGNVGLGWGGGRGQTIMSVGFLIISPLPLIALGMVFLITLAISRRLFFSNRVFNVALPVVMGIGNRSLAYFALGTVLGVAFLIKQTRETDDLVQSGALGHLSR